MTTPAADTDALAAEILSASAGVRQIPTVTARNPGFGLAEAYRVTARVLKLREARGERVVGRKVGFTNRTIWDEYGVHAPIWAMSTTTPSTARSARASRCASATSSSRASSRRSCSASRACRSPAWTTWR